MVAQKVTAGVYKGVTTSELDELAAETAASLTATHPDYALVSNEKIASVSYCSSRINRRRALRTLFNVIFVHSFAVGCSHCCF